jgi:glyoxylase-like metal-dependent hydrolase (beta-lactamase superfamily II)
MKVHQIRIDFHVTEQISRFVYVYILEAGSLYLIDSGVAGCEKQILAFLDSIGRDLSEIKGIFITHAHPDHIGSAAWFREHAGCRIYASEGEKRWIEDIDLQFKERPIPNFYQLAGKSVKVDAVVKDGDEIELEDGTAVRVIRTAGHSCDEVSYLVEDSLFIGDSVPVKGDIPIFIDEKEIRRTLRILKEVRGVKTYYPAWDRTYTAEMMDSRLSEAAELIDLLRKTVSESDEGDALPVLTDLVCGRLKMPWFRSNPLFMRTIECLRKEE